jgi:pimeloyl-ACP methyl ester carboxylesterase
VATELTHASGFVRPPWKLYWERFTPVGGARRERPLLCIHGSNQTGACYRTRVDGGPGWVDDFTRAGYEVVLVDWPGTGRSGSLPLDVIDFRFLVDGFAALIEELGPVDVIGHSMGGFASWKLRERLPELVARVVGVAPGPPRQLIPRSEVLSDDGTRVRVRFAYTVEFEVDRSQWFVPGEDYIQRQAIGPSTRFPREHVDTLRASMVNIPPLLLVERLNIADDPGLELQRRESFSGARILIVTGTNDPVHPREVDEGTADFLRSLGADVTFLWLGDRGIEGNGHLLMGEENSGEIAALILEWLET